MALRAAGEALESMLAATWRVVGVREARRARSRPSLVLVVDDLVDTRELYKAALGSSGFRVEEACDGAEGIEKAIALQPSIIVMDFGMPCLDGGEAVRRLSVDERTRGIPVLMVSAFADRVPRDVRLACAAFLAKPCDPDELSGLLHLIVSVRSPRS